MAHFAWEFEITGTGDDDIYFEIDGTPDTVTIATDDDWRVAGDGSADDIIQQFEDQLNAHSNIGAGTFTVTLLDTGKVQIDFDQDVEVILRFAHASTTFDSSYVGFSSTVTMTDTGGGRTITGGLLCKNAWFPAVPAYGDGYETIAHVASTFSGGRARRSTTVTNRIARFDARFVDVIAQRIWPWTADESAWMTPAGLTTGDENAAGLYRMWDHLVDGDGGVYYYDSDGSERGPYYRDTEEADLNQIVELTDPGGAYYTVRLPLARDYS